MRKFLLITCITLSLSLLGQQQFDFYYLNGTTIDEAGLAGGEFSTVLKFKRNQAGDPVTFMWEVLSIDTLELSPGASVGFGVCDNVSCYANLLGNQIEMAPVSGSDYGSFKLQAFQVTGDVKFVTRIHLWDKNTPSSSDTLDLSWRTDNWVSLDESKSPKQLSVYPNPASDQLRVSYNFQGTPNTTFELISVLGTRVYKKDLTTGTGDLKLDVSNLSRGIYFYAIKDSSGKVLSTKKLVLR